MLSEAGHHVVILDNLCNSDRGVLTRLAKIIGKEIPFVEADVRDTPVVTRVLQDHKIDAVIHFAGLKAVGESVEKPIEYYANNVQGSISLLEAMKSVELKTLVFSSSATVYGKPNYLPIDENHPTSATNSYGRSKLHIEEMLQDLSASDKSWRIACLRYFNPVGAHSTGLIGEAPNGVPSNLMPYICKVAAGELPYLNVYGNDYDTNDGTGVRDYVHVIDLALGHQAALNNLQSNVGLYFYNLGTGRGNTVLEMISTFEKINKIKVPYKISERRQGDVGSCFAAVGKAESELNWSAKTNLDLICSSAWNWQINSGRE